MGFGPTLAFKLEVWGTAKASAGNFGVARGRAIALPFTVHRLFGSPAIPASDMAWAPGNISARLTAEATDEGFVWSPAPAPAPAVGPGGLTSTTGGPSAAATLPRPSSRGRSRPKTAKKAPASLGTGATRKKPKRKSHPVGLQGRALLQAQRGPAPLDPALSVLEHFDARCRQLGQPVPDRGGVVAVVLPSQGSKRALQAAESPPDSGEGEGGPASDMGPVAGTEEKRARLGEPAGHPLVSPIPLVAVPAMGGAAVGAHFPVQGSVSVADRLEAYYRCMKKLFGVDAADGVTWLSRCAAIFPAFSKHDSGDNVLTNNVLESYHSWLKNTFFRYARACPTPPSPHRSWLMPVFLWCLPCRCREAELGTLKRRQPIAHMFNVILEAMTRRAGDQALTVEEATQYRRTHRTLHSNLTKAKVLFYFGNEVRGDAGIAMSMGHDCRCVHCGSSPCPLV